jgi:hypothetical protein
MNHEGTKNAKEGKRKGVGKEVKISNLKSKNADIY